MTSNEVAVLAVLGALVVWWVAVKPGTRTDPIKLGAGWVGLVTAVYGLYQLDRAWHHFLSTLLT